MGQDILNMPRTRLLDVPLKDCLRSLNGSKDEIRRADFVPLQLKLLDKLIELYPVVPLLPENVQEKLMQAIILLTTHNERVRTYYLQVHLIKTCDMLLKKMMRFKKWEKHSVMLPYLMHSITVCYEADYAFNHIALKN